MSINLWRYVLYTQDGCADYQCLMCYNSWESRTTPGYTDRWDKPGAYYPTFIYCPFL